MRNYRLEMHHYFTFQPTFRMYYKIQTFSTQTYGCNQLLSLHNEEYAPYPYAWPTNTQNFTLDITTTAYVRSQPSKVSKERKEKSAKEARCLGLGRPWLVVLLVTCIGYGWVSAATCA